MEVDGGEVQRIERDETIDLGMFFAALSENTTVADPTIIPITAAIATLGDKTGVYVRALLDRFVSIRFEWQCFTGSNRNVSGNDYLAV